MTSNSEQGLDSPPVALRLPKPGSPAQTAAGRYFLGEVFRLEESRGAIATDQWFRDHIYKIEREAAAAPLEPERQDVARSTSPSPRPDPQTIARLDRGTAEDRHRAALMHPRRLGAPGCICDLDVADSGTAQPLDVERLALDDPIVKALRYPCKEPMHKEAARALEARLAASGDERHEADWSDEKRKEQLRLRNAEEDRL